MRRVRQDHRELELRLGASISVHRLSSQEIRMTAIPNAKGILTSSQIDLLTTPTLVVPECIGSSMPNDGRFTALAASAILLSIVSLAPRDARAEEPGRPKTTGYPAVEDVPPRPAKPAMTADEQLKLKKELSATRDRQAPKGKAGAGAGQRVKP